MTTIKPANAEYEQDVADMNEEEKQEANEGDDDEMMDVGDEEDNDDAADEDHIEDLQEEDDEDDLQAEEESDEGFRRSRRSRRQPERLSVNNERAIRKGRTNQYTEKSDSEDDDEDSEESDTNGRRRSSRATKNKKSMKEPTDSVRDLLRGASSTVTVPSKSKKKNSSHNRKGDTNMAVTSEDMDEEENDSDSVQDSAPSSPTSPPKSRGRHSKNRRKNKSLLEDNDLPADTKKIGTDDEDYVDGSDERSDHELDDDTAGEEDDETMKMQRILASRSETRKKWKEICSKMNSSEVTDGSRWFQGDSSTTDKIDDDQEDDDAVVDDDDDDIIEERFLVKWNTLSYLHVTWETQQDLLDQVDNAKSHISTFFRKSVGGILFSQDERKDGDYFDPGFVQIDRILEVTPPDGYEGKLPTTWDEELAVDPVKEFNVVLDKTNTKAFESGVGRQFLVKFFSLNYSDCSYEFERDLMLLNVDFRDKLKEYYERSRKPSLSELNARRKKAEDAMRRAYLLFGEKSNIDAKLKVEQVAEYQRQLQEHVYENGGQLRDYQAEGVTWFLSNYVNKRSCIMADEMGLGKTLQTAAFIHLLVTKMHCHGPFLISVPLSTVTHWQREFIGWTGLNTIVYHGSSVDRQRVRELEFAYKRDRPHSLGVNSKYLKNCNAARKGGAWMATVVITTPEILVADDWTELTFVRWRVFVVDEAHRMKNHNSKLAINLRDSRFQIDHKLLLTGTPIQNDVKEFWTLLNFIEPNEYHDMYEFLGKYGDIKSKDRIDELHETIRPYILRRLKEDVEKSVPPKEETLIEVELTLTQKQYYRALYEKNVQFLHKNKKKALDGPSLNNLAMQLRKCCNHLFLLNGVEEDMREKEKEPIDEGDFVTKASGKLVLLDKLLPRLKQNGHRILLFSQFKIMLDILEDYLVARHFKFERIDGSITGHLRQAAIDRFQDPNSSDPPFVMLLSTRAGGVGINLTAADTCIIYDSDWNPQNDIQAMARCHRIGQTKDVKVYRLLTRKTYEMQMFHLSSLKMGLDQAVLTGFENSSGEGALTKEEVERLLRHGAYDIFNEDKAGTAESESNAFIEQDIDSILERRSRTVVHQNTGSGSVAAGGTFSKASFTTMNPSKDSTQTASEDIDINDPDFWTKMVGEAAPEAESVLKPRKRFQRNYNEKSWDENLHKTLSYDDNSDSSASEDSDESEEDPDNTHQERYRWGGNESKHWQRSQAQAVIDELEHLGYGLRSWEVFADHLPKDCKNFSNTEIQRMAWSTVLTAICEVASSEAIGVAKRNKKTADRKRLHDGDGSAEIALAETEAQTNLVPSENGKQEAFQKIWSKHSGWANKALEDAITYANSNPGRNIFQSDQQVLVRGLFYDHLWPALQARQWRTDEDEDELFFYEKQTFKSPSAVMNEVVRIHPELQNMVIPLLNKVEQARLKGDEFEKTIRAKDLSITGKTVDLKSLEGFLQRFSPMQLVFDRQRKRNRLSLGRRLLSACHYGYMAVALVNAAKKIDSDKADIDKLSMLLVVDGRTPLPHPLWSKKHDATLVSSIAMHGWCDIDRNMKYIIKDNNIRWGYPFEITNSQSVSRMGRAELQNLKSTAERAASILNTYGEIFNVFTSFNKNLVIESYGLTQLHLEGGEHSDDRMEWKVDHKLLHQSNNKNEATLVEPADLPPKRDLAKRAKIMMEKSHAIVEVGGVKAAVAEALAANKAKEVPKLTESYGYTLIDQSDRCYILLAELVRTMLKASPKHRQQVARLWQVILDEAAALEKSLLPQEPIMKNEVEAIKKIVKQLTLAKLASKTAIRQGKNVLRCMIGENPQPTRYESESQFPDPSVFQTDAGMKAAAKKKVVRSDPSLGERAVLNAVKKISKKNMESPSIVCHFGNLIDDSLGLPLTLLEIYILTILCSKGVPLLSCSTTKSLGLAKPFSWEDIAKDLELMARLQLQGSIDFVQQCNEAVSKAKGQGHKPETIAALEARLSSANNVHAAREFAAATAADVISDPLGILGKKSALLLESIRKYAGFAQVNTGNKASLKHENYLGPKVLGWFRKQMNEFAVSCSIVGDDGQVLGGMTYDLLKDHANKVGTIPVSGFLDKKGARDTFSQTAMMTRLRSILLRNSEADLHSKLIRAIKSSKKYEDPWEKRPLWWDDSTAQHSYLLLTRLEEYGFSRIMDVEAARDGFGAADEDYNDMKDLQFTKPSIQLRANQLVRELHSIEDHEDTMKMLERRKSRNSMDSLAACHDNKGLSPPSSCSSASKKNHVQTGLKAFFTADHKTKSKENDRNGGAGGAGTSSPDFSSSVGKRKESPTPTEVTKPAGSAEKKPKVSEPPEIVEAS